MPLAFDLSWPQFEADVRWLEIFTRNRQHIVEHRRGGLTCVDDFTSPMHEFQAYEQLLGDLIHNSNGHLPPREALSLIL